ncbi:GGDEF domain-containing protein [Leptospira interrogans serovar Canicola]|nr:GGDEF domain-containing protein [Leptospira interrogans serovar Canicola]EKO70132.1 diguanylate cyclase (GGDEF) domain protein [Leptospira interrogans serovar Canicola str. Fiocruz LV133]EMK16794.1 diguanylate cyclase (GGDEF) domain protein [Leptospira interrogans str. Kito]EMN75936.1 diguanylate cyclase (GGDEF) domain protein [Leptospira interrogans str. UI 09600]ASV08439.1 GGDEF domain-containing protein [Leptospira interrogans serovar Canicola]
MARFGGEEFVVALPETGEYKAIEVADRLVVTIQKETWENRPITISVGIATLDFSLPVSTFRDIDFSTRIVEEADRALYRSKANGRNQATHCSQILL